MAIYSGPVIDAHHHIWEVKNYPWLLAPMTPKMFGDYEPLRHDYSVDDLKDDFKNQNVVKSVHVQANWDPSNPVGETEWLQSVADKDKDGFPHGIVAFADMTKPAEAEKLIEGHLRYANMRGVRHQIFWHEEPLWRYCPRPDMAADPVFRQSFKLLKKYDLSFDLQMFPFHPVQLETSCALLAENPDTRVILVHSGMLPLRRPEFLQPWREGLRRLAEFPNLWCKISGLALLTGDWTLEEIRPVIEDSIEIFGIERCLFGSNFPLERMWASYDTLLDATKKAASSLSDSEARMLFHDNAAKFYRL